jgi:hypothetical protein
MAPLYAKIKGLLQSFGAVKAAQKQRCKETQRRHRHDETRRWWLLWFISVFGSIHLLYQHSRLAVLGVDRNPIIKVIKGQSALPPPTPQSPVYSNVDDTRRRLKVSKIKSLQKHQEFSQVFQRQQRIKEPPFPPSRRQWAYAFLLGGVDPSTNANSDYHGGLLGILAAAHSLRYHGSQADIVVMVQMSANSNVSRLPSQEAALLHSLKNVHIYYLPRFKNANLERFYSLVLEKFRILQLDMYSRVMFVDNDILPKCNLDYLFDLSESTDDRKLKSNIVFGYKDEPANAGLFVLQPNRSDHEHLQQIILQKEQLALQQSNHWDPVAGWGHTIKAHDRWTSPMGKTGTNWTWFGAFADQGLLYHWTKYVKHDVSLIYGDTVENIGPNPTGGNDEEEFVVEGTRKGWLKKYSCNDDSNRHQPAPYRDFIHFTGFGKPWWKDRTEMNDEVAQFREQSTPHSEWDDHLLWYWHLEQALTYFEQKDATKNDDVVKRMFDVLGQKKEAPVGRASHFQQMFEYIVFKKINKWNQYEA